MKHKQPAKHRCLTCGAIVIGPCLACSVQALPTKAFPIANEPEDLTLHLSDDEEERRSGTRGEHMVARLDRTK